MSKCSSIGCLTCLTYLWIGQSGEHKEFNLYSAPEYIKNLEDFLMEHKGHFLIFNTNDIFCSPREWIAIETDILDKIEKTEIA